MQDVMLAAISFDDPGPMFTWGRWVLVAAAFTVIVARYHNRVPRKRFAFEVGLIVAAYFAYFLVRGLTQSNHDLAVAHGWDVVHFERSLGIQWEDNIQDALLQGHWAVTLANWMYIWGHWPVIALGGTYLMLAKPMTYRRFRNAFLISGGIAIIIFATFPVAPPRMLDLGLVDTVTTYSHSYRTMQPHALTNQYAAVPSLHFGWDLLIGIALWQSTKVIWVRIFAVAAPTLMCVAIIVTANHYIIDAVAGGAVALTGLAISIHGRSAFDYLRTRAGRPEHRGSVGAGVHAAR
jgi:hypothetical protein